VKAKRVLGIDPGTRVTGYGIVEGDSSRLSLVACGEISLDTKSEMPSRLGALYDEILSIIAEFQPESAAVEKVFVSRNADSALKLGHARGVVLLAVRKANLDLYEYTPAMVKKSLTGNGRAEKFQVAGFVQAILGLSEGLSTDASDALAVACCHLLVGDEISGAL
jgi:crossover junction endodeoxyribonuclease RuvC